jgi:TRAP-type C4-dicarboxylate transport system substrate-binding protein
MIFKKGMFCGLELLCAMAILLFAADYAMSQKPTPKEPQAALQTPIKIRISDVGPMDEKVNTYYLMAKIIGGELEKYYPGRFKMEYYPSAQLYKPIPAHKAVLAGDIEVCYSFDSLMEKVYGKEVGYPFMGTILPIFRTHDEYWKCAMEIIPKLSKAYLEPRGGIAKSVKVNFALVLFLTKPASSLADLKGRKIRIIPGEPMEVCARFMGLNPVAMESSEALVACKSGTVDGILSGFAAGGVRLKFYSAAKYITPHDVPGLNNTGFFFWNLKFWNSLPEDVREKLDKEIIPKAERESSRVEKHILDTGWDYMTSDGAVRLQWSDQAIQEYLVKAALPTVEVLRPKIGEQWMDILKKYSKVPIK